MKITEQPDVGGKFVLVVLEGKLTDESRYDFREHFSDPLLFNRRMIFDFAKVSHMTGDGIGSLVDIFSNTAKAGGRMSIGNVSEGILSKLSLVHLADVLGADQTIAGAVKKLRRKRIESTQKEQKPPTYTSSPCHIASTLRHAKCGYQFTWFEKQFPRFCPGCGRSTKK